MRIIIKRRGFRFVKIIRRFIIRAGEKWPASSGTGKRGEFTLAGVPSIMQRTLTDEDFRAFVRGTVIRERRIMSTVRVDSVVYLITTFSFPPSARVNSVSANLTSFLLTFLLSLFFLKFSKFRNREGNKKFFEINTIPTRFRIE